MRGLFASKVAAAKKARARGAQSGACAKPTVSVERDFDGLFECYVNKLLESKMASGRNITHKRIIVTSGPYRAYDARWESSGDTLRIDFYSVARFHMKPMQELIDDL